MVRQRRPRDRQRGNSLVLALIVLSALATLGSLTVVSVQSSLKASTNDRSQSVALYAAESGAAYAMDFLRANQAVDWTTYFTVANIPVAPNPAFPTNQAKPTALGNPFSTDQNAYFDIQFFNNRDEGANDLDKRVIIHSTGHGPQESVAVVEWEVQLVNVPPQPPAAPGARPPAIPLDPGFAHYFVVLGWHVVDL